MTYSPSATWTGQQMVAACFESDVPLYLIRDRDRKFGGQFNRRVEALGIKQILTSYRSPWQNPYVERVIGSIRRECLDHVIILTERHLRRVLRDYLDYYYRSRTHLGLEKDYPVPRSVEPPEEGDIQVAPILCGLHHRYSRRAASSFNLESRGPSHSDRSAQLPLQIQLPGIKTFRLCERRA